MLNNTGFDLWADDYDKAVGLSDEDGTYPFAGYRAVLGEIYSRVLARGAHAVLDIGFGTGTLTARLYSRGCRIYGQDFSARMLALAQPQMPDATLVQADFAKGLAQPLTQVKYDAIIATYALHHLTDAQKIALLQSLLPLLNDGGCILIGDVAFADRASLEACRAAAGDGWDADEFYFVYDELHQHFPYMTFEKKSHCAGVIAIFTVPAEGMV